ncbi:MAG: hypothetical protein WD231_02175 [Candidatus Woykebacteria bacterium]
MNKHNRQTHIVQYAILLLIFLFTVPLLFIFRESLARFSIILFLSFFYFASGIWHHTEEKNLTKATVLEYLAISILIFVVLFSVFR